MALGWAGGAPGSGAAERLAETGLRGRARGWRPGTVGVASGMGYAWLSPSFSEDAQLRKI